MSSGSNDDLVERILRDNTDCSVCGYVRAANHLDTVDGEVVMVCPSCCSCPTCTGDSR